MEYPNGSNSVLSGGPWMQLLRVTGAMCDDGKARTAHVTGQPDTAFSIPARVSVKGNWVTGFVTMAPDYREGVKEGYIFHASKSGKNYTLLPQSPLKSSSFELWSYDVWGNARDGFEVNDRCCLSREFQIEHDGDSPSDKEIRKALIEGGYLKPGFPIETDGDDMTIEVNLARNGCPLFGLEKNC